MHERLPSFRGIEAFITTANALSLRIAASHLNISVSAVSRRISALEEEIGVQLFIRGSRKLYLTQAGAHYRENLQPTLDLIRHATKALGSSQGETIKILGLPSFFTGWLAPRLKRFTDHNEDVSIDFNVLRKRVVQYSDIIIEPIFLNVGSLADSDKLFSWIVTAMGSKSVVRENDVRDPRDLSRAYLLDLETPIPAWNDWLQAAGVTDFSMLRWMRFDSFPLMMSAASEGLGFALFSFFQKSPQSDLIAPFEVALALPGGVFLRKAPGYERPIVRAFRSWLMDEVARARNEIPKWATRSTGIAY